MKTEWVTLQQAIDENWEPHIPCWMVLRCGRVSATTWEIRALKHFAATYQEFANGFDTLITKAIPPESPVPITPLEEMLAGKRG